MPRSHRQWTSRKGLEGRQKAPTAGDGEVACVQCNWPIRPDEHGNSRCGRCGVAQYVNDRGGRGRWPDGMEPEYLRLTERLRDDPN